MSNPVRVFLSYARGDDEGFVWRLHRGLTDAGFDVWFDRVTMPSRQLNFSAEIESAIAACDRLILVVGPNAVFSDYVTHEWRFAFHEAVKCVNAIIRLNGAGADGNPIDGYELIPDDLRGPHVEDFRDDSAFDFHLANLVRQLSGALPPLGKLVAVPSLPDHFLEQGDRIRALRDVVLADLRKPVVVTGSSGRVGLHGMGGIGKSLLANALARRPEIRREFPDGVYWVTLGQRPLLVELQRNFAKALGDDAVFTSDVQGRERLRELLKDRAAFLILDDVWQREHAEAFNVIGPRCRLLLTTRDSDLVTALAASENHFQVHLPNLAEARYMLAKAAGIENPDALPSGACEVVEECNRLPLALALCGGMVRRLEPWGRVLAALRRHKLEYISDRHPLEEQHASIWRAMDASVRVLGDDKRKRFAELAVFTLDTGAPEPAVLTLWEHTAGMDEFETGDLLSELFKRSLIERSAVDGRITLHDLVHNFAVGMTADQPALHRALLDAYRKKCPDGWPRGPNDGYFFENLCRHLVAGGRTEDAAALLESARWGLAKCDAGQVFSLEQDYVTVAEDGPLDLVHKALALSLHVLARDSHEYASQMVGRLLTYRDQPVIEAFLAELTAGARKPWIRPMHPALDPPGTGLVRTLAGHLSGATSVAVTPDGERAVSASYDRTLKVWDIASGRSLSTLEGHSREVRGVAMTPDGRRAVSASRDKTLRLWDLATGQCLHTLEGHSNWVLGVAVTPDGERALSGSWDYTLRIWDLATGRELRTLEGHSNAVAGVAVTPDGLRAVSASWDKTLKVWDLASGECLSHAAGALELGTRRGGESGRAARGFRFAGQNSEGLGLRQRRVSAHAGGTLELRRWRNCDPGRTARGIRLLGQYSEGVGSGQRTLPAHAGRPLRTHKWRGGDARWAVGGVRLGR